MKLTAALFIVQVFVLREFPPRVSYIKGANLRISRVTILLTLYQRIATRKQLANLARYDTTDTLPADSHAKVTLLTFRQWHMTVRGTTSFHIGESPL